MFRLFGPGLISGRSATALVSGAALTLFSASPAAAEVCDKEAEGLGGWLGLVLVLGTLAFFLAAAFGRLWPAFVAAGIAVALLAVALTNLVQHDPVAMAAWREGCGRSNLVLEAAAVVILILLGFLGRRQFRARLKAENGAPSNDERG